MKIYRDNKQIDMAEAYPWLSEPGHVVSLVGAGGKTSLMYQLADYTTNHGLHTLVTTTTHIMKPGGNIAYSLSDIDILWAQNQYAVIGYELPDCNKLSMPDDVFLEHAIGLSDMVLIEADGSKHMPCKVPNLTEPVIIDDCDIVIGLISIKVVGRPLKDVCFRLQEAMELLGTDDSEHIVSLYDMCIMLTDDRGIRQYTDDRRYIICLNQCETASEISDAAILTDMIYNEGYNEILSLSLI